MARLLDGHSAIAAGMARQGFDISLTRYDELGWRATFYVTGHEHSPVRRHQDSLGSGGRPGGPA